MDLVIAKALVLGIVEGLTEFLPISSTGHLILAGELLRFDGEKAKLFEVVIQSGAMLAVVWEYRGRLFGTLGNAWTDRVARRFVINVAIAFLPAVMVGLAFGTLIKAHLFKPVPVAVAFIIGAFVILWAERRKANPRIQNVEEMTASDALRVGFAQCFALIPGTSRAGATIIGGMLFGLSRRAATEFSFFLAVPTLLAAGAYDLFENRALLHVGDAPLFAAGSAAAFVSALFCVRWLIRFIATHDMTAFAWYRILFGLVVLGTASAGWVDWRGR